MDDLISRQAAIDALKGCYCGGEDSCGEPWIYEDHAIKAIEQLPSAQPEIIRCKDCKYNATSKKCLNPNSFFLVPTDDDFCSYAEKREVAT